MSLSVSLTLKASPLQAVFGIFGSLSLKFAKGTGASIAAAFAQAIESRECVNTSARLAQPDGSLRFLQVSVSPESGGTERPIDGLFTILFDVTERTRLLSRSERGVRALPA